MPLDYAERVYAGVLGKVIGVYVGRPFEQWSHEAIEAKFGEIRGYVNEVVGQPLVVADDDISGTFTFVRALADNPGRDLEPADMAENWLNYIIENRSILWWGGLGNSTEHTAFLRLKHGVPAPESGSIALNGKIVAEQIGAQIFIDGFGLVCPNDPAKAARLARVACCVSHDGEAIYGAQMVAAMVALAFGEKDIDRLIDGALEQIPAECLLRTMIGDVRAWHAQGLDWRAGFAKIREQYGYELFPGGCHMIPNHAVVIHALLHGKGSFRESMMVVNTVGYDTDCNSANVGCILGVRNGLAGFEGEGYDWRGPVADRVLLPTADGGRCVCDAAEIADSLVQIALSFRGDHSEPRPRFHFGYPGSVQGFQPAAWTAGGLVIEGEALTPTFLDASHWTGGGYATMASPMVNSGQTLVASVASGSEAAIAVEVYNEKDELTRVVGEYQSLPGILRYEVPDTGGYPIARIGLVTRGGPAVLRSLDIEGEPSTILKPVEGKAWRKAWVNGVTEWNEWSRAFEPQQNEGTGLLSYGRQNWRDVSIKTTLRTDLATEFGVALRVQGMRRYVALLLHRDQTLRIVRCHRGVEVLAEKPLTWALGKPVDFEFCVKGGRFYGRVNGVEISAMDDHLEEGAVGIVLTEGRLWSEAFEIRPS